MLRKVVAVWVSLLIIASSIVILVEIADMVEAPTTLYVGGAGGGNYSKIQWAIDNASDGDTVFVYNGTYFENVNLNKRINLIGEDNENTIINGVGGGNVVLISKSWVNMSGFSVTNDIYGIYLASACSYNNISYNNIYQTICGIYLSHSNNNTITNNTVSNNGYGIYFSSDSIYNRIYHNNIINNTNQAHDDTNNGNQWDNGYPSGGNYWSDYFGNDSYKGPYQDIPGNDGTGDIPYDIFVNTQDNYPLINPYKPLDKYLLLKQGWNLISIPYIQVEQNLTRVLGSIESWYDAVQWYDNTDPTDPWKHHKLGKPFGNDLSHLNETMSFWIHITNPGDTIFLYNGTPPSSNQIIPLHPGWNMVGYPSLSNHNRTVGLNNLDFGTDVDCIQWYDAATKNWHFMDQDDYFTSGRGYWVHSKVEAGWEVPL